MQVRDQDILLPTTMVGSYPRPKWLTGKVFGEYDEPDFIDYRTKENFTDAVRLCVDDQRRAGVDVICDGQQYYESEDERTSTGRSSISGDITSRA